MSNALLRSDLAALQAALARCEGMVAAARAHSGMPVAPHGPAPGLVTAAEALGAQQELLGKIVKLLDKLAR